MIPGGTTEPPAGTPAGWGEAPGRIGRLVRKELVEILRDRRTLITLVLMPLLLYPLLTIGFQQFFLARQSGSAPPEYRIGFVSEPDALLVLGRLGWEPYEGKYRPTRPDPTRKESAPPPVLSIPAPDQIRGFEHHLWDSPVDLGVRVRNLEKVQRAFGRGVPLELELIYLKDSPRSLEVLGWMERQCALNNVYLLRRNLERVLGRAAAVPVETSRSAVVEPGRQEGSLLTALIPLVLILMTITGAVYPAIDLTAGERERGTLEILVAAPVPRLGLLFAKYVAVLTVAVLTALVNLVMMTVTLLATGLGPQLFGPGGLSVVTVLEVFGLLLLFASFFAAVLLTLTSFARSFKEAQAYLIPLMLASLAPGLLGMQSDLKLSGLVPVVPLLNIVLLARDLFQGQAELFPAVVVVLSTLLYALAALAAAARVFGAEGVLYSEQGAWSDLFRRPAEPRPVAPVAGALGCVALAFPAVFLLQGVLGQLAGESPALRLGLQALLTILVFAGFPLAAATLGRVRPDSGFQLRPAPWPGYLAALLLGVSLWPFVLQLLMWLRTAGLGSLGPEHAKKVQDLLAAWRQLSPAWIVLTLAVVPAVCEELFFRGYLFSALRARSGPAATVLGSAALFGLFHSFFTLDQVVSSTLLGLVLGWVCWRTGSVFPGMLLHGCHNTLMVLLAYYQDEIRRLGWLDPDATRMAPLWLAAAGLTAALGFLLLGLLRHPPTGGENPVEGLP